MMQGFEFAITGFLAAVADRTSWQPWTRDVTTNIISEIGKRLLLENEITFTRDVVMERLTKECKCAAHGVTAAPKG